MASGITETDPRKLAHACENFMNGVKRKYEAEGRGDMWLFELFHHLSDCASALRRAAVAQEQARAAEIVSPPLDGP